MGRPTRLTPERAARIVALIRAGNYLEVAASAAGVSRTSLRRWLKIGDRMKTGPHADFAAAVEKASGEAECRDVALISKAAAEHWQAAAWRLERKNSSRWGRTQKTELTGKDGGPVAVAGPSGVAPWLNGLLAEPALVAWALHHNRAPTDEERAAILAAAASPDDPAP